MEPIYQILLNLLLSFWGVLLSLYYKGVTSPKTKGFSLKMGIEENYRAIGLTLLGLFISVPALTVIPEVSQVIQIMTGLDIGNIDHTAKFSMAYLTYGHLLYSLIRNQQKKHVKE